MGNSAERDRFDHRRDIDGLRAIAILAVVGFHGLPGVFPGGFVGVDVFFVISGFLITGILIKDLDRGDFSLCGFYARRVRRIFPALAVVLASSLVAGWFLLLPDEFMQLGRHTVAGAGFVQNFLLWSEAGYFDTASELKPLLHLWSLAVEEQFYLGYPVLLWMIWFSGLRPLPLLGLLVLASFALNVNGVGNDPVGTFYLPHTRLWELLAGGALAWWRFRQRRPVDLMTGMSAAGSTRVAARLSAYIWSETTCNVLSILGLLLIVSSALLLNKRVLFPGWWALLPVIGAACIISAGPDAWLNRRVLGSGILVFVGLISYPLYLWHWPLLAYLEIAWGPSVGSEWRLAAIAGGALLAWLTFRYVEQPVRQSPSLQWIVPAGLAAGMVGIGIGGYWIYAADGLSSRFRPYIVDAGEFDYSSHFLGWISCRLIQIPDPMLGACMLLSPNDPLSVAVIGDSHAGHLAPGLRAAFEGRGASIVIMEYASCNPIQSVIVGDLEYFRCPGDVIEQSLSTITATATIEVVIMSGYALKMLQGQGADEGADFDGMPRSQIDLAFERALTATLRRLVDANKTVVYLIDIPDLVVDPRTCLRSMINAASDDTCTTARSELEARHAPYRTIVDRVRRQFPEVSFIDTWDALCDTQQCYAARDGVLLYQSKDHLSPSGSRYLMRHIAPKFPII